MTEREDVRRTVAIANRVLTAVGLADGPTISLGHVSMRLPGEPDKFYVKGRGYAIDALPRMRPDDMILCDLEGNRLEGPGTQCYEVKIHSCIYKARPDVQSVVHVHPQFIVLMSILGAPIRVMAGGQGMNILKKPINTMHKYKIIQSEEEGQQVADILGENNAMLLLGHGVVVAGTSPADVVVGTYGLEEQAKMNYYAYSAAGPNYPTIPQDLVEEAMYRTIPFSELSHFQGQGAEAHRTGNAVFDHYAEIVSRDL